jgi:cytochrome c biogenesis protein ResB
MELKDIIKKYSSRFFGLFRSLRFAALVIALLILMYFLGLVVPQKILFDSREEYMEWVGESRINRALDFYGFTDIYLSPITITLLVLFFITLLVITVRRVPFILRKAYLKGDSPSFSVSDLQKDANTSVLDDAGSGGDIIPRVRAFFKKRKWHIITGDQEGTFMAVKNRFSPLGFLLFHFSFFLCLIGGIMIMYTRFSGNLALTEGQAFEGDMRQLFRISKTPKFLKELPPFQLYVKDISPFYEHNVPVELQIDALMNFGDEHTSEVIRINEPITRGALSIIAKNVGISPLFIVRDSSGREIDGVYVSLNVLFGLEDSFSLELDRMYLFEVLFYPDFARENGEEFSRSIELRNPAINLVIKRDLVKKVYEGTIMKGEPAEFDSYTISFEDLRYWVNFIISREYGRTPLIWGFIMAAAGLIMRLVFFQKRVRIAVGYEGEKTLLYMSGKSEYFVHAFNEEMRKLTGELKDFLQGRH